MHNFSSRTHQRYIVRKNNPPKQTIIFSPLRSFYRILSLADIGFNFC